MTTDLKVQLRKFQNYIEEQIVDTCHWENEGQAYKEKDPDSFHRVLRDKLTRKYALMEMQKKLAELDLFQGTSND